jgi:quercetin dioxygenase-like cupin family protein
MGSSTESCGPVGVSFLGRRLPPRFQLRVVTVAPGQRRAYDQAEWRDALVVVERGELELECLGGSRCCFGRGDVLCLDGLPLRALRNRGREPAVLAVVSRRGDGMACRDGMER